LKLFLTLVAFAGLTVPGLGSSFTIPPAGIDTSITQCETQTCGFLPPTASYNGNLSGYPGMLAAGDGASNTAAGFPFPTLNSEVPTSGANAIITSELTYVFDVVPLDGSQTAAPVEITVDGVGTTSTDTVGGTNGENNGGTYLELAVLSDFSGDAVFSDIANISYSAGFNNGQCVVTNNSGTQGAGFVSTPGVGGAGIGCGESKMSGGFNESGSYSISTNSLYEVVMIANITVGTFNNGLAQGPGSVQASAFVDPMLSVPVGYQLELSDGVGNGTPEPATWTLFAAGIGLILAKRRRVS
jgi:hypothetical protein